MEKWLKICHTGEMKLVEMPCSTEDEYPNTPFLDALYRELNCDSIEIVHAQGFRSFLPGRPAIIIDECGKLKDGWEDRINCLCTLMYAPGVDCIVGDALLGMQLGPELVPFPESVYEDFAKKMVSCFTDCFMKNPCSQGEGKKVEENV